MGAEVPSENVAHSPLLLQLTGLMVWGGRKEIQREDKPQCNSKGLGSDQGWPGYRRWR